MSNDLSTYLKSYSKDEFEINKLLVSAFLYSNSLYDKANGFLQDYLIREEEQSFQDLLEFTKIYQLENLEELVELFEFVISPAEKIVSGAVYTPQSIRSYILDRCLSDINDFSSLMICDPACGCSGFLYSAAKIIKRETSRSYYQIFAENLFGLDIQEFAITRSKILLSLLAISEDEVKTEFQFNLFRGNSLNFNWSDHVENFEGFTTIVGNPPYVCSRNIDNESKQLIIDWDVSSSGHPDLYIPFFQIGYENLLPNGMLGFITMNTFFRSVNGRALRQYFEDKLISLQILDFGSTQIFQSKSTYTCICVIQKTESKEIQYSIGDEESLNREIRFHAIPYHQLNHINGWNLQSHRILNQIEGTGQPFGNLYRTRNGIATLKNHIYIFSEIQEDREYYYLQNGAVYPIEKGICKEIVNPNKLTREKDVNRLRQKAIFPYRFDENGNANLIEEVVFKDEYPKAYEYMEAKRKILATRDKGSGKYPNWYAYGRNQSLEKFNQKLFFPHITPHIPNYSISDDQDLLFYNGLAVVSDDQLELRFLQKLMSSELFWFYITHSSKPYGSGYFSLSRNYIKNFGVAEFSEREKEMIIDSDLGQLNQIVEEKYQIHLAH